MFAQRLLVDQSIVAEVPRPARYDSVLQLSVASDGTPFVEASENPGLVTLTEASGESADDDRTQLVATSLTQTFVVSEGADEHDPTPPIVRPLDRAAAAGMTETKAIGEAPDSPVPTTENRQAPDEALGQGAWLWAITKTEAPGEAPDQ